MTPIRTFCLALIFAAPILADDLIPAPYRGLPLTTLAEWDFLTDQPMGNIQPDGGLPIVRGSAAAALDAAFPVGALHPSGFRNTAAVWAPPSNGGYLGAMSGTGFVGFNVPAFLATLLPATHVRLQVTYAGPPPPTAIFGFLGVPGTSSGVTVTRIHRTAMTSMALPPGMSFFYEDWVITPAVDWFQVVVFLQANTFFDQGVIESLNGPFSQPSLGAIFADGFESGSTLAWSMTLP